MKKVIFSIYIDIDEHNLDNPGHFDWRTNKQTFSDKSLIVKQQFKKYEDQLEHNQEVYATTIDADHKLFKADEGYKQFLEMFLFKYPEVSEYDVINFYKHWKMKELAETYDHVCYMDFDVIPNTIDSIFDIHDLDSFACAESNADAEEGKNEDVRKYRKDIRNPATKYWNAHAMLTEVGYDGDTDVFNTGIMVATSEIINKFNYFESFEEVLKMMTFLKEDEDSFYHENIKRVFGYDNETVFAYRRIVNDVKIDYINEDWHQIVLDDKYKSDAKLFHVINKKFEWFFDENL